MRRLALRSMNSTGTGWPQIRFTVPTDDWAPPTFIVQVGQAAVQVVSTQALATDMPVYAKDYGVHFAAAVKVGGQAALVPLHVFDQGRVVDGATHRFGVGLRLDKPSHGTSGQAQPLPSETRLLPFVIVAKLAKCDDDTLAAVYAELRLRGIGSGSYELLTSATGGRYFVYDCLRSPAYWLNTPGPIDAWWGPKPAQNMEIVLPTKPAFFTAWVKTTKALVSNSQLWLTYGATSSHNRDIRKANAEREERSPKVNAKRRAMADRMTAVRACKPPKSGN